MKCVPKFKTQVIFFFLNILKNERGYRDIKTDKAQEQD